MSRLVIILFVVLGHQLIGQSILVKPYIQDITETSVKIMLETSSSTSVIVRYGTSPFDLTLLQSGVGVMGNGLSIIYTAHLNPLLPATKYYYKVELANGVMTSLNHFTTYAPVIEKLDVNLVAVSDMQQDSGNPTVFANLVNQGILIVVDTTLPQGIDDLHGLIIPGDLVDNGGNYISWKNTFFTPSENLSATVPFYPSIGNHEYYNSGQVNYLKYFDLPQNGPSNQLELVWSKDISNIRIIALNSNATTTELNEQLTWLNTKLTEVCSNVQIDFVFVQLHHPFHSELWTPGESGFTGHVIDQLESWASHCNKVSAHFFGHTHAYSRGQSRDHQHVMVNVATAGGAIDNWGEYPNADYPEYSVSQDEYGFVLIQTTAGEEPTMRIRRFGRGDQNSSANNVLKDEFIVKNKEYPPAKPTAIFPIGHVLPTGCVTLRASAFDDAEDIHQASQWQIASTCDFDHPINIWKQHENWYNEINTQENDLLIDETLTNLTPNSTYCWRVRYRDSYLKWSSWSDPATFTTSQQTSSANLIVNHNAESGTNNWTGQIEALTNNECNSVPVYAGIRFFAVGGVCANESSLGAAFQVIDVVNYSTSIDQGIMLAEFSAYMRSFGANNDKPEMYVEFFNVANQLISISSSIIQNQPSWQYFANSVAIPVGTRSIKVWLKGTRLAGSDNDSYFDELSLRLIEGIPCLSCVGSTGIDADGDKICADLDCDDTHATVYPGALELCDGLDNNCDGLIESGNVASFSGAIDNDWHKSGNWTQNIIPLPCQKAVIPIGKSAVISQGADVAGCDIQGQLTCLSTAILTVGNMPIPNNEVVFNLNGKMTNAGKIVVKNSSNVGFRIQGDLDNIGRIYISNNMGEDFYLMPAGVFNNSGVLNLK